MPDFWPRGILHVDMDAFFAAVEVLDRPELAGKPVLVGGAGPRGVVAAASYEARTYGCHSAQPMAVALRNCPHAVVVAGRYWRYREVSRQVFAIFDRYTPQVQPLSIDEAFLDVTASQPLHGPAEQIAAKIRADVRRETKLTCSVGVAPNKFLAKLASDLDKPDGLTIVRPEFVDSLLPPLAVTKIYGVGPSTARRLAGLGIKTIGDLRTIALPVLERRVGTDEAAHYRRLAFGIDDRPVEPDREAKSIGQEQTFGTDLADPQAVRDVMLEQSEEVAARVRRNKLVARSVTVKIRFGDFQTITRRTTLPQPTDETATVWAAARELFDAWAATAFAPVRLIGVTAAQLAPAGGAAAQLELFPDPKQQKRKQIDSAVDAINAKFGKNVVHRQAER
ncbi:MAG TPA: DNA polymerase IV [Tepidisphaeraceae bacterium]|nr:DNA polymerase IV [Tepidisphaeraceae bacterium]